MSKVDADAIKAMTLRRRQRQRSHPPPPRSLPNRLGRRLRREVRATLFGPFRRRWQPELRSTDLRGSSGTELPLADLPGEARSRLRKNFLLEPGRRQEILSALHQAAPGTSEQIVKEADRARDHVFDLLGSGPVALGETIDWHADFKSGHRWNPRAYYTRIRAAPYPGGFDLTIPWELSRCQHLVRLGQAYWLTENESYAREITRQIESWIDSNPWPLGVNWASGMDASIRAVNWLWALAFLLDSASLTDAFLQRLAGSLLLHGRHIFANLKGSPEDPYTGNHYVAQLLGLLYLSLCCPYFRESRVWRETALAQIWLELSKQVYPDGADYEASMPYHRLVAEMYVFALLLSEKNEIPVPEEALDRIEKMIDFIHHVTKPDGTVPILGDQDNGRVVRLAVWPEPGREWQDFRYLLAIGGVLFERESLSSAAEESWQEAIWLFGSRAESHWKRTKDSQRRSSLPTSRAFQDAGIYVLRREGAYMLVDAGRNGKNGTGVHAHNDTLSFELHAAGQDWIVDPGSYVYTADYEQRNLFRSTAYHNVVSVDDEELHPMGPSYSLTHLFLLGDSAPVRELRWEPGSDQEVLDVEHECYLRLPDPVLHRREFRFFPAEPAWRIRDSFVVKGKHRYRMHLHLAPRVQIEIPGRLHCSVNGQNSARLDLRWRLEGQVNSSAGLSVEDGWVSRGYGERLEAPILSLAWAGSGDVACLLTIKLDKPDSHIG